MKRFIHQFGKTHLIALLADREFIGSDWLAWLKSEGIDFHVRIKKDAKLPSSRGVPVQAKYLFQFLKAGENQVIQGTRTIEWRGSTVEWLALGRPRTAHYRL